MAKAQNLTKGVKVAVEGNELILRMRLDGPAINLTEKGLEVIAQAGTLYTMAWHPINGKRFGLKLSLLRGTPVTSGTGLFGSSEPEDATD